MPPLAPRRGRHRTYGVPMEEPQIYEQLTQVLREVFDQSSLVATPELEAKDVEGWDSLTHVRLLMTVQKRFKVKFSTTEIRKLERVGDLVQLIRQRA